MPRWVAALAVALLAALVAASGLRGGFVSDDKPVIADNALIRGQAPLAKLFASPYWDRGGAGGLYRPLTILSFAANYAAGGLAPLGYHLVNVLLHAAASALVFLLLLELGLARGGALFGAAAFAVWPVHAEAFDWCVGRAELLAAVFALSAWLAAWRAKGWPGALSASALFALAVLSKENAAALVPALLMAEWSLGRLGKKRWRVWAGLAATLLLYFEWRWLMLGSALGTGGRAYFTGVPFSNAALTMARFIVVHYLWPLATGFGLRADFSRPSLPDAGLADAGAWLCLFALAGLIAWALKKRRRPEALGALLFFVLLLPVLNVVPIEVIGAERFLYLPSLGAALAIGALARRASGRRARVGLAVLLLLWSWRTWRRARAWSDETALWVETAVAAPDDPRALNGLAIAAAEEGRGELARRYFLRAAALDGAYEDPVFGLGKSLYEEGRFGEAEPWFKKSLALNARDADALCFLGLIAQRSARLQQAERLLSEAVALKPYGWRYRFDLGLALAQTGDTAGALEQLAAAERLAPSGEDTAELQALRARLSRRSTRKAKPSMSTGITGKR